MRTARTAVTALVLAAAAPASAQLSTRSIALESGVSVPADGRQGALASFALSASSWLDADAEAVARVALRSEPRTDGRGSAPALCATAGARLSLGPDPLRPQVQLEVGWLRARGGGAQGFAIGIGGGLEWFPARDLSLAARVALRGRPEALGLEASLAAAAYF